MDYLKRRQKTRRRLYSKWTLLALAVLLILMVKPTLNIIEKSRDSKKNLDQAEHELADLENRKRELARDVAYLKSEYGRDQEIRDKFGVVKENETMVVIVRNNTTVSSTPPAPEPSFLGKMWSGFLSFFGLK